MTWRYTFTVFTPTFNRAHTLHRVYQSLTPQTFRDFEWLVVDDGSTDNTRSLVSRWQDEADFTIRYYWQENAGLQSAWNLGAELAEGELFLKLDSDDECVPHALERLKYHWDRIPEVARRGFVGVTALVRRPDNELEGTPFPHSPLDSTALEIRRYKVAGDKWGFLRTTVVRRYPFPIIEGERFVPDSLVWNRMAARYRTRFVNEVLLTYYPSPDSLTSPLPRVLSPRGTAQFYREFVRSRAFLPTSTLLRAYANRVRYGLHAGEQLRAQWEEVPSRRHWLCALFPGLLLHARDRHLLRRERRKGKISVEGGS